MVLQAKIITEAFCPKENGELREVKVPLVLLHRRVLKNKIKKILEITFEKSYVKTNLGTDNVKSFLKIRAQRWFPGNLVSS